MKRKKRKVPRDKYQPKKRDKRQGPQGPGGPLGVGWGGAREIDPLLPSCYFGLIASPTARTLPLILL